MDAGSLFQLQNALQRKSVTAKIKSDPTAYEEFFLLVVEGHILSLVMQEFQLPTLDDTPCCEMFSKNFVDEPQVRRQKVFSESISKLIKAYMHVPGLANNKMKQDDHIVAYSTELLSLGLLYMEFVDAIREGDGGRILRTCFLCLKLQTRGNTPSKHSIC